MRVVGFTVQFKYVRWGNERGKSNQIDPDKRSVFTVRDLIILRGLDKFVQAVEYASKYASIACGLTTSSFIPIE
ncbi:MAG: hypothetical protein Sylvanvirus26_15 [Sylvanvirus sp.]|uniref:Uncharacterized protein n=1 Tax=Sylvanvirus sp. TaxID=2487774 RepID=A0A3G5AIU6_9VIRU|nr:MAG: hypothetical protein Sylvanvirus26_15 [Sylvanvirus sp.]